jgi:aryl-alcohol dehydrogenase-like predicted oxidoreductase
MMQKRELGKSGIKITPLVLGGNVFGWTATEARSFEVLDAFVDLGGDAIDTAPIYSAWIPGNVGGESETIIGAWVKRSSKRDKVKIATKVGRPPENVAIDAESIKTACEESLRRLSTDYIDLYQVHFDDGKTPPDEYLRAFEDLKRAGKVRLVGASNMQAPRLIEALRASEAQSLPRFETMQPQYNLMRREIEQELAPACMREQVSILSYFSLAAGYLTGKYRTEADLTKSTRNEQATKFLRGKGPKVIAALDEVAARRGASVAQCALAWLLAKPGVGGTLASANSVAQLKEIIGALDVKLSADDVDLLDQASG